MGDLRKGVLGRRRRKWEREKRGGGSLFLN